MEGTCGSKSFKALMVAQFISAFNDNALKIIVSLLAIKMLASPEAASKFVSLIGLIFMLPFVIFSPYAGILADRFPKRSILIAMEGVKVLNMCLAFFAFQSGNLWFLCFVLFLLVVESAFLSPAKYGILPEMLKEEALSRGNGFLQMWTFIAIIAGTVVGGRLLEIFKERIYLSAVVMIVLAVIGFAASLFIKSQPAVQVRRDFKVNIFAEVGGGLQEIRKDRGLFLTMLALCYFSFLGAVFQMNILIYGSHILKVAQSHTSLLLVAVLSGIALGGVLSGRLSDKKVELGLVPVGAAGICFFCFMLGLIPKDFISALLYLFFLGISAGFYTVPLNAFYQRYSPLEKRGQYLAVLNIISSCSVLLASGFLWFLGGKLGINPAGIFLVLGILSITVTVYIVLVLPTALVRLINLLVAHSIYNYRAVGVENVPDKGGALIASNHISFVDAVLILACLKRPVRFIMNKQMYELPIINLLCRALRVIPLDPKAGPKAILSTLNEARNAIKHGELVCIFPEGHLSRTGNMLSFQKGFEFIMKDLDAPIIPMYLDNIWGSIFSYSDGKYFWKMPRSTRYPVSLVFGKPMQGSSKVYQVRLTVQELGAEASMMRGEYRQKLHLSFIDVVKRHTFCFCMADSTGMRLRYFEVLTGALALSRTVFPASRRPKETNEMVGVLFPSSCVAAMTNLAIAYSGKVPVNLNFTLSIEAFNSCIQQCNMKTIITSRAFIEKIGMVPRPEMVFVEDINNQISKWRKAFLAICSIVMPRLLLQFLFVKGDKKNVDDVATVIFSSGSTGEPKGVMLTHANIFSNIESFYQVFDIKHSDVIVAALPFFHSFGFTATLCFPIGTGIGVVYHTNPMDATTIGKLTEKYKATMLMGTPTFMSSYLRKCTPEQFATVRMAVVGAEKLKESLAQAFYDKFKVMPFEGYGATELSPIVTVGFPGYLNEETKEQQLGHKIGKVGHPIPGVAVKIVDPGTFEIKNYDEEGLLLVKGANVMKGYLNNPTKTAEVIKDGWYITGDIASIDSDGFVKITDRLSRFSKIGGEMVSHIKIEENIIELIGSVDPIVAVTSVSDDKKGEKLVVLHTTDLDVSSICEGLAKKGLPNLWIPKKENFYRIETIPLLGTGKVDLKKLKLLAQEFISREVVPDKSIGEI
jgi:acyl-[acyl-carrier-protein]-phospholipid O-acyltransferase/long-chain-fatty-acid--[acyl-carrier-protein] ligase